MRKAGKQEGPDSEFFSCLPAFLIHPRGSRGKQNTEQAATSLSPLFHRAVLNGSMRKAGKQESRKAGKQEGPDSEFFSCLPAFLPSSFTPAVGLPGDCCRLIFHRAEKSEERDNKVPYPSGHKKTDAVWHPFLTRLQNRKKLLSGFRTVGCGSVREAPADFVALGSGTQLALLAFGRGLKCAATAHFFEDALGIKFGLEAFESTVNGLAFFHNHSTHAILVGWFGLVPQFLRGAVNALFAPPCQDRTHGDF
jgi:hypothetical protein